MKASNSSGYFLKQDKRLRKIGETEKMEEEYKKSEEKKEVEIFGNEILNNVKTQEVKFPLKMELEASDKELSRYSDYDSDDDILANINKKKNKAEPEILSKQNLGLNVCSQKRQPIITKINPISFQFAKNVTECNALLNQKVTIYGKFLDFNDRKDIEEFCINLGAEVSYFITKKTTLFLHGKDTNLGKKVTDDSLYKTAVLNKIPISEEQNFLILFLNKFGVNPIQNNTNNQKLIGKLTKNIPKKKLLDAGKLWVNIFAPTKSSEIISNKSQIEMIKEFITSWENKSSQKIKDKALLISGPPGIGKTTSAKVCSEELGKRVIILNASDSRNKSDVTNFVGVIRNNRVLNQDYLTASDDCVLIMDEVDGMSGDKGGITALVEQIKNTKIPIICICNDASSNKIRSLSNNCKTIKFLAPTSIEIAEKLSSIFDSIESSDVQKDIDFMFLASSANGDIRQAISNLQFQYLNQNTDNFVFGETDFDTNLTAFEACKKLMSSNYETKNDLLKKWFFSDFSLVPLFVFENYFPSKSLYSSTEKSVFSELKQMDAALDCMMKGDFVNRKISDTSDFSLLNIYGYYSSILPMLYTQPVGLKPSWFPMILGKISSRNKRRRIFNELRAKFAKSQNFLSNDSIVDLVLFFVINFGELFWFSSDKITEERTFENIYELLKENDLDKIDLKEHFLEISTSFLAENHINRYKQFLSSGFFDYLKKIDRRNGEIENKKGQPKKNTKNGGNVEEVDEEREQEKENKEMEIFENMIN